ncbi:MAG: mechanosensitive ion channel family protein, partial [Chloroflexota bacterium]|nr:mechanosensitive ion channel family protein [Chloroflexota bacterium]
AAVIFVAAVLISLTSRFVLKRVKTTLASRTSTKLDDLVVDALALPVAVVVVLAGAYIALNQVSVLDPHRSLIRTFFVVAYILIGTMAVGRAINVVLNWYGAEVATRTQTDLDEKLVPVLRRVVTIVVYSVGLIIILGRLGVEISPLIAGLGIGGLAVALAVHPTLTNFLAGTYVMSDGVIGKGDYVDLDSGQSGFVEEIGWRITKLRHWQGNLIVLPNSKLSEAIITNYEKPEPSMLFLVECGVSYSSDLQRVEEVTLDVARQIIRDCPDAPKDFVPALRFREFGDSNIGFIVVMKSVTRVGQFMVKHEFIKALHVRFNQEGIEIQYPARKLYFADGHTGRLTQAELMTMTQLPPQTTAQNPRKVGDR